MSSIEAFTSYLRQRRTVLRQSIDLMRDGTLEVFAMRDGERVNTTSEALRSSMDDVNEIDDLLEGSEAGSQPALEEEIR